MPALNRSNDQLSSIQRERLRFRMGYYKIFSSNSKQGVNLFAFGSCIFDWRGLAVVSQCVHDPAIDFLNLSTPTFAPILERGRQGV
jgi:hypothetical protein